MFQVVENGNGKQFAMKRIMVNNEADLKLAKQEIAVMVRGVEGREGEGRGRRREGRGEENGERENMGDHAHGQNGAQSMLLHVLHTLLT